MGLSAQILGNCCQGEIALSRTWPTIFSSSDRCLVLFSFFPLCKIFNTGIREENFTDSARYYPTSHKYRHLIFSCDAHPIGEHEVQ